MRNEVWHEKQEGRDLPDGRFELKLPYLNPHELEMDILRHGENVEVMEPRELREGIAGRLAMAARRYATSQCTAT